MLGSSYVCRMVSHLPELPLLQNGLSFFRKKKKQIDKIRYKVKKTHQNTMLIIDLHHSNCYYS